MADSDLFNPEAFSEILYEKMSAINPGIGDMELYEFRYAIHNLYPQSGWSSIVLDSRENIEHMVNDSAFYDRIQIKPRVNEKIVLDDAIVRLAHQLFVGLVTEEYPIDWVNEYFYFDIRGFFFLHRTLYFTDRVLSHLGGKPLILFDTRQVGFDRCQDIGYKQFKEANEEVDQFFIESVRKLITAKGTPILLAIAGPTAAGKTEIAARLRHLFETENRKVSLVEMDNFLTDRDYREEKGIFTLGKRAIHFDLFKQCLENLCAGKEIAMSRYDFIEATSSHDLSGKLKPGGKPIVVQPADVIFMEGNFPFLIKEVAHLIGIKVVYLTDDPIRMKRKWKRDIDYRKKYEPTYFRNRYFRGQYLMAQACYLPQMEICDMVVDTTGAALWATPEITRILQS
ncbi:MAG: hypothetical protein MUO76_13040 [Anaerolineaceae bacterium]|nr:hypothetical protein [Anaerolineaceae bacterium]